MEQSGPAVLLSIRLLTVMLLEHIYWGLLQVALSPKGQYSVFISVHFVLFLQLSVFKWLRITCLSVTCQLRNVTYFRLPSPESSSDMRNIFNYQKILCCPLPVCS